MKKWGRSYFLATRILTSFTVTFIYGPRRSDAVATGTVFTCVLILESGHVRDIQ